MHQYNRIDRQVVGQRLAQFRGQLARYRDGELSERAFRPLRLQNGLYLEKTGPMLRVGIPYGQLSSEQMRALARVASVYAGGRAHFTTRQNVQFYLVRLEEVSDVLSDLARVDMHSIQTAGACIRNITVDPFAGTSAQEIADPRPTAEILRRWASMHPEFSHLPRKVKIAISGGPDDAAGTLVHDIGFQAVRHAGEGLGFRVMVGGGQGRAPAVGQVLRDFLPHRDLLTYTEAILRIYNLCGHRDNPHRARMKMLIRELGLEEFARRVDGEWRHVRNGPSTLTRREIQRVASEFERADYETLPDLDPDFERERRRDGDFARWTRHNTRRHRVPGYASVVLSLKRFGSPPGDAKAHQMELAADLAESFSSGEIRTTQGQNLILPDVRKRDLYQVWQLADSAGLATPNVGLLTDITACPGGDSCSLAHARSIPLARAIQERFGNSALLEEIGEIKVSISGCLNACSQHHTGHVGVLGVDRQGEEFFQLRLGGSWGHQTAIAAAIGPPSRAEEVPEIIENVIAAYRTWRLQGERFIDTYRRVGPDPFRFLNRNPSESIANERGAANG